MLSWCARIPWDALLWLLVGVLVVYRFGPQAAAALGVPLEEVTHAPSARMRMLDGGEASLDQYRGRVVVVNFWATWCPPCRVEMPGFQRVYRERRADGLEILAVAMDRGAADEVQRFVAERGITFPVVLGDDELKTAFGGVRALPTSFLIDRSGRIRHRVVGFFSETALRAAVDRLLAEEPRRATGGVR